MPERVNGAGAASDAAVRTDGPAGPDLKAERRAEREAAKRAVATAKEQLADAEKVLARLEKESN